METPSGSIRFLHEVLRHRETRLGVEVVLRRHFGIGVALLGRARDVVRDALRVLQVQRLDATLLAGGVSREIDTMAHTSRRS